MKRIFLVGTIVILLAVLCPMTNDQYAYAYLIDFESFNLGGGLYIDVPSPLAFNDVGGSGVNVNIVAGAYNRIYDLYSFAHQPGLTGQALIDWNWPSGANPAGTTILFSSPVSNFSLQAGDFGSDNDSPLSITAYDGSDNVIGSVAAQWPSTQYPPFATLSLDLSGISKIVYNSGGAYSNSTFIDNINFSALHSVPEPSTLLLFCAGLLGAGIMRKTS